MWLEFVVAGSGVSDRSARRRTVPLVDNFPLMAWMSRVSPGGENQVPKTTAESVVSQPAPQNFCVVARVGTKDVKAQV